MKFHNRILLRIHKHDIHKNNNKRQRETLQNYKFNQTSLYTGHRSHLSSKMLITKNKNKNAGVLTLQVPYQAADEWVEGL